MCDFKRSCLRNAERKHYIEIALSVNSLSLKYCSFSASLWLSHHNGAILKKCFPIRRRLSLKWRLRIERCSSAHKVEINFYSVDDYFWTAKCVRSVNTVKRRARTSLRFGPKCSTPCPTSTSRSIRSTRSSIRRTIFTSKVSESWRQYQPLGSSRPWYVRSLIHDALDYEKFGCFMQ